MPRVQLSRIPLERDFQNIGKQDIIYFSVVQTNMIPPPFLENHNMLSNTRKHWGMGPNANGEHEE